MKLFLTGGTGFIGSHVLAQGLAAGHRIMALRRPGSRPRIALTQEPFWIDGELDGDHSGHMAGVDVFLHLASHTPNVPYDTLERCLYWNVFASLKLAEQARQQGVRDFLIAGSCFEYGLAAEGQDYVHPATELRPISTYAISKAAASIALLGMARQSRLRMQLLRMFQVYGEGEAKTRFWPTLRAAARSGRDFPMSTGTQIRDFVDVSTVADQFLDAIDFRGVEAGRPQIKNIGSGIPKTLLQFAQEWWLSWGATGRLIPGQFEMRPGELGRLVANVHDVHIV